MSLWVRYLCCAEGKSWPNLHRDLCGVVYLGLKHVFHWQVSSGYLVVVFVYVTEFTGIKVRTWTSMHVHAAFAVGVMVVALVGHLIRVWWLYQVVLSLSTIPFILVCWKLPETPFYLLAKGRLKETQDLLDQMAYYNGASTPVMVSDLVEPDAAAAILLDGDGKASNGKTERKLSILDLFCSWRMAVRTLTVWAVWFIGSLGYYVFSLNSVNLGGNQYVNLFLAGETYSSLCLRELSAPEYYS